MMCPDNELLSAFIDGEVQAPWRDEITAHLQQCPACRQIVSSFRGLSRLLQEDPNPDYRPSMQRIKTKIDTTPGIIAIEKTPFWKKRLNIPVPIAAAAALLIIAGGIFSLTLANSHTGSRITEAIQPALTVENQVIQDNDPAALLRQIENKDFKNEVIIRLPDDSRFSISGEPQLIRAKDLIRRK